MRGGEGDDVVIGGAGADGIFGRAGNDVLLSGVGPGSPLSDAQLIALSEGANIDDVLTDNDDQELRDDGDADTLDGGTGDDILFSGASDSATGGGGLDAFGIFAEAAGSEAGPSVIEDYSAADDVLFIYFQSDDNPDDAKVTVEDDGDDAIINLDGEELARVIGAAGAFAADDIEFLQMPSESGTTV